MKTVFLADAHLKGHGEAEQEKIGHFLGWLRGSRGPQGGRGLVIDHLVIAGDFFDFWFARGERIYPGFAPIIQRLGELQEEGVRIALFEGNHDFHLGDYFTARLGIEVMAEGAELPLDGLRVWVAHGDTVDQGNHRYLFLRRFLRSRLADRLQGLLPLALLWDLARHSSRISKGMNGASHDRLATTMHRFAREKFHQGYDAVVLGHCHKPLLIEESLAGRRTVFATLGDWTTHDTYLLYDAHRFSLLRFPTGGE